MVWFEAVGVYEAISTWRVQDVRGQTRSGDDAKRTNESRSQLVGRIGIADINVLVDIEMVGLLGVETPLLGTSKTLLLLSGCGPSQVKGPK